MADPADRTPADPRVPLHSSPGASSLAPRAFAYLNFRTGLLTGVTGSALAAAIFSFADPTWRATLWTLLATASVSSLIIEMPWLNRREVLSASYSVTPKFVYLARGWLFRRSTVIAATQILNVEIVQGPLLRLFNLVSLRFTCISEVETLGPLEWEAAERARAIILGTQSRDDK